MIRQLQPLDLATLAVGDVFSMMVVDGLLRTQIVQYAGASGDFHPYHHDEPHAQADGFPAIFAHGMLTMGLTGRLLSELVGDQAIRNFRSEMRKQVWPGDTLTASATVDAVARSADHVSVEFALETTNQHGELVLVGSARIELD